MHEMPSPTKPKQHKKTEKLSPADRLLAAGVRVTYARVQVLEVLSKVSRAVSHADIEALFPVPLDKVTLYRTLDRLIEAKLIHKAVGDDRITRFGPLDDSQHHQHAHFHCDDCGMVYCLDMKVPKNLKVPEGFGVESMDVSVHGHCSNCNELDHRR